MQVSRTTLTLVGGILVGLLIAFPAVAQTTISNIDDSNAWFQPGTSTPNFSGNANTSWMAQGVTTHALDANGSQEFHVGGSGAYDSGLWWANFPAESNATTFSLDFHVYTDQNFASVAQAVEFGVSQFFSTGAHYRMAAQCDFVGGNWRFYDPQAGSWVATNRTCVRFTAGWNHFTFNFQRTSCPAGLSSPTGGCAQFVNMIINGTTYAITKSDGSGMFVAGENDASTNDLKVTVQLDLDSADNPYEIYMDEASISTNGTPDSGTPPPPPSPLPVPPSNATHFANLQVPGGNNPGTWNLCNGVTGAAPGANCAGGSTTGSSSLQFGQSPTNSGTGSMLMTDSGPGFNTMYYRHLGCPNNNCAAVKNMLEDMWFRPVSVTDVEQLEFDPDLYSNNLKYFASVACRLRGTNSGHWFLWNSAADTWEVTGFPCTASTVAAGTWHHLQLYVTFDTTAHTYTYKTFVFDGQTVFQDLNTTYSPFATTGNNVSIEQQIDNDSNNVTNSVYYDSYNLWVW